MLAGLLLLALLAQASAAEPPDPLRLMIVIQDRRLSAIGEPEAVDPPVLAPVVGEILRARGHEIGGVEDARRLATSAPGRFEQWLSDIRTSTAAARQGGADLLIAGHAQIENLGKIEDAAGLTGLKGRTKIEVRGTLRAFDAASGVLLATAPIALNAVGAGEQEALARALEGRGRRKIERAVLELLEGARRALAEKSTPHDSFEVVLHEVDSMRDVGQPFLDLLRGVAGVKKVASGGLTAGALVASIQLGDRSSANELIERIRAKSSGSAKLAGLELVSTSGTRIAFRLVRRPLD